MAALSMATCMMPLDQCQPSVYSLESTPLNKLAVADAAWARMPVDGLNMTLA